VIHNSEYIEGRIKEIVSQRMAIAP